MTEENEKARLELLGKLAKVANDPCCNTHRQMAEKAFKKVLLRKVVLKEVKE
jgi:hypothetical protein